MDRNRPAPAARLCFGKAGEVQVVLVEELGASIRTRRPDQRRNGVDGQFETAFAPSEGVLGVFSVVDIRDQRVPTRDAARRITRWDRAHLKPSVDAVEASKTCFVLERLLRRERVRE